jgi:predicted DNA-binding transcriptional regulator AlpA
MEGATVIVSDREYQDQLLTEVEAAQALGYSPRALQNWRLRGGGPRYVKVSARSIRYRRRDLIDWIDRRTREHSSENVIALPSPAQGRPAERPNSQRARRRPRKA